MKKIYQIPLVEIIPLTNILTLSNPDELPWGGTG